MIVDSASWNERIMSVAPWIVATLGVSLYLSGWLDAKLGADLQARVGPNRTGRAGIFQPFADSLRALSRSIRDGTAGRSRWFIAAPLFGMLATIPAGAGGPLLQAPLAIFVPVLLGLCFSWIGIFSAWRAEDISGRLSSLRQGAAALAAAIPALVAIAIAGLAAGGFGWEAIERAQGFFPTRWLLFSSPFAFVGCVVFLACGIPLFALPSRHRAVCGGTGSWGGLARSVASACWGLAGVEIFMGGSRIPLAMDTLLEGHWGLAAAHSVMLVVKVVVLQVAVAIAARTLPQARADMAHDFAWRVLAPLAMASLAGQQILRSLLPGGAP